ncbi:hypothetical protein EBZ39_00850 [bacterium]|nr:hypothetical protein [bacterium]
MKDTALYIKFKGRGWAVWHNDQNELIAIPEDEKAFDQDDLLALEAYLFEEGFFASYYLHKLSK